MIYNSLSDNGKKIQLCTHLQNLNNHLTILGLKPLSLTQIHQKMTGYYQQKMNRVMELMEKNKKTIEKINGYLNDPTQNNPEIQASRIKRLAELNEKKEKYQGDFNTIQSKLVIFTGLDERLKETENCPVCWESMEEVTKSITPCGHFICYGCLKTISHQNGGDELECPMCRFSFLKNEIQMISDDKVDGRNGDGEGDDGGDGGKEGEEKKHKLIEEWGTKFARMIEYVTEVLSDPSHRIIIFSQWDKTLSMVQKCLNSINYPSVIIQGPIYTIQARIQRFKTDPQCRVVLLSSSKSASGVNLTEASHVLLLDSLNTTREEASRLEEQSIGRAVRLGQTRRVQVRRLIIRNTLEHDFYLRNIGVAKYEHLAPVDVDGEDIEEEFDNNNEEPGDDGIQVGTIELGNVTSECRQPDAPMVI